MTTDTKKRYINLTLEGEGLKYFEAAFEKSGIVNVSDYIRGLIRKDFLETVKPNEQ